MNKTMAERKICPYYKAAILSGHDFALQGADLISRKNLEEERRALEDAIHKYATCDGVACEHAVIKRERGDGEPQTTFIRCGRRYDAPKSRGTAKVQDNI